MEFIGLKDFEKLNLRVGKITGVKPHPELPDYILLIDMGLADRDMQIVADLKQSYTQEELMGKQVVFLENVPPAVVGGVDSLGLLLVTEHHGKKILISPEKEVHTGMRVEGIRDSTVIHHTEPGKGC